MPTEKAKNNQVKPRKKLNIALVVVCGLVLLVLFDIFTPVFGGQVRFYAKWMECGRVPFSKIERYGSHVDSYATSSALKPFRENRTSYFCNERQAELSGLSANAYSYDFPHLTDDEISKVLGGNR